MYQFREVDQIIVNRYNEESPKGHIFQTSYWAEIKGEWSSKYIAGYSENGEVILTCMMLLRKIPYTGKFMGYIPRGFTCDYTNTELIMEFRDFLKDYGRKNKIAFITVDPDIHLKEDEAPVEPGQSIKKTLMDLDFINKKAENFENIQPNFVFRLDIHKDGSLEDKKKAVYDGFTPKTRYNIKVAQDRGLTVEVYDRDNITEDALDRFQELMTITGKRDNFIIRPKKYFKNMIERIYPYSRLYLVKYNYESDFSRINEKLQAQAKNKERLLKKKEEVLQQIKAEGDEAKAEKLKKKLNDTENSLGDAQRQIASFEERINEIKGYKDIGEIYVSGAIYIYYGGKGWYFYGASHNELRDTMPNFLMQWSMISDSIDLGCTMYDFRGVSGDLNPENPLYGLYKFKKGFNGKFVEFIGEFELVINGFVYKMFKYVLPKFKAIRRKITKRK